MVSSVTFLALVSSALALQVTSPDKSTVWAAGTSETVKWDTVSSDQTTFNVYLSNMVSYPPTNILLASDVSSSSGSLTVDGSKLVAGNAYTINFTNGTKTEQIYAQSVRDRPLPRQSLPCSIPDHLLPSYLGHHALTFHRATEPVQRHRVFRYGLLLSVVWLHHCHTIFLIICRSLGLRHSTHNCLWQLCVLGQSH